MGDEEPFKGTKHLSILGKKAQAWVKECGACVGEGCVLCKSIALRY